MFKAISAALSPPQEINNKERTAKTVSKVILKYSFKKLTPINKLWIKKITKSEVTRKENQNV
ncbi:hypothetical protein GCM10022393_05330 [Aquimarina addita]|uniref:Uncharacterized protein n=1 Tax=Aquimarina addita TaxID=870485 RepID=A0ABP7XAS2_9FLAO